MIVATLLSAGYARPAVLATLATLLTVGVAERMWAVGVIDSVSFSLVGLILVGPARAALRMEPPSSLPIRNRSSRPQAVLTS
jgi:uncharacterized membrane protein